MNFEQLVARILMAFMIMVVGALSFMWLPASMAVMLCIIFILLGVLVYVMGGMAFMMMEGGPSLSGTYSALAMIFIIGLGGYHFWPF